MVSASELLDRGIRELVAGNPEGLAELLWQLEDAVWPENAGLSETARLQLRALGQLLTLTERNLRLLRSTRSRHERRGVQQS